MPLWRGLHLKRRREGSWLSSPCCEGLVCLPVRISCRRLSRDPQELSQQNLGLSVPPPGNWPSVAAPGTGEMLAAPGGQAGSHLPWPGRAGQGGLLAEQLQACCSPTEQHCVRALRSQAEDVRRMGLGWHPFLPLELI